MFIGVSGGLPFARLRLYIVKTPGVYVFNSAYVYAECGITLVRPWNNLGRTKVMVYSNQGYSTVGLRYKKARKRVILWRF